MVFLAIFGVVIVLPMGSMTDQCISAGPFTIQQQHMMMFLPSKQHGKNSQPTGREWWCWTWS